MRRLLAISLFLLLARPAGAQEPGAGAEAEGSPKRPPTGWLSDPDEPPRGFLDALVTGKLNIDNRTRVEWAETTGRLSSTAVTNRIRLGYSTKPLHGFSGLVEMENVATPDVDRYSVPPTGDGNPDRTTIADPPGTEVNQAFVRFLSQPLGGSEIALDLKAGRQRIRLDDERFIGAVGWRQFEQTFDAASIRARSRRGRLSLFYAYVGGVQRIFGPNGPNPDSTSHLVNGSFRARPELEIIPFAYLLDFRDDDPMNSVNSYGLSLAGQLWRDERDQRDVYLDYRLTYARQDDAGSNPVDFVADFVAAEAKVSRSGLGSLTAGYQLLGSDDGTFGFRFPLGTNHAFQGFADNFLVTPPEGLQDLYLGAGAELPWGIRGRVIYHRFWSDVGSVDLGWEIDLVAVKAFPPLWQILAKAAFFDGKNGQPRTTRAWLQVDFRF